MMNVIHWYQKYTITIPTELRYSYDRITSPTKLGSLRLDMTSSPNGVRRFSRSLRASRKGRAPPVLHPERLLFAVELIGYGPG